MTPTHPFHSVWHFISTDTVLLVTRASVKVKQITISTKFGSYWKHLNLYSNHYTHVHATPHTVVLTMHRTGVHLGGAFTLPSFFLAPPPPPPGTQNVLQQQEPNLMQVTPTMRCVHGNVPLLGCLNEPRCNTVLSVVLATRVPIPVKVTQLDTCAMDHHHPRPHHTYPAYLQLIHRQWQSARTQDRSPPSAETALRSGSTVTRSCYTSFSRARGRCS